MHQIFVLEDDREIAVNLTRLLHSEGYGVSCESTVEAALTALYENGSTWPCWIFPCCFLMEFRV